jgi:tetratricopeptide (TPR) repeat protein
MKVVKLHIALLFLLASLNALAQPCVKVGEAIKAYQAKDLETAKKTIDAASADPACASDPSTWYYKAFFCKDYYRAKESTNKNAPSRIMAIEAAKKNVSLDPKNKYAEECKKIVNFLSVTFYNDAASDLNLQKYQSAYGNYVSYLETIALAQATKTDTSAIFYAGYSAYMANNMAKAKEYLLKASELQYKEPNLYYYLGKTYWALKDKDNAYKSLEKGSKLFPENKELILTMVNLYIEDGKLKDLEKTLDKAIQVDPKNLDLKLTQALVCEKLIETEKAEAPKYFEKAERLYKDVLKTDPNNLKANYNLAILYYNKAVNIIDSMDPESDLTMVDKIQDQCVGIFKQSLPFMSKAFESNPNRCDILEGLSGIYFALNDLAKSNEYKKKAEDAGCSNKK